MKHEFMLNNELTENKNRLVSSLIQNITHELIKLNTADGFFFF